MPNSECTRRQRASRRGQFVLVASVIQGSPSLFATMIPPSGAKANASNETKGPKIGGSMLSKSFIVLGILMDGVHRAFASLAARSSFKAAGGKSSPTSTNEEIFLRTIFRIVH